MLYSDRTNLELIIKNMQEVLSNSKVSTGNAIHEITIILYVSDTLPQDALESLLTLNEIEERESFITKELIKKKIDKLEAQGIAHVISSLNKEVLFTLFTLSLRCELPNYDVARILIDLTQSQGNVGGQRIPNELADLSFSIACQFDFDKENLKNDCQDLECLTIGGMAESIVIRSGNAHNVKYEMRGIGIGATFQKILIALSGGTIDIDHQQTPNLKLSSEQQFFNVGFLADTWGLKSRDNTLSTSYSNFNTYLSDIRYLEEMVNRVDGVVVCILPSSWLNKTSGSDAEFKMHLIQSGIIEAIIQLPERIMATTSLAPNILVINTRRRQSQIKFINASDDIFYSDKNRNVRTLTNSEGIVDLYNQKLECERTAIVNTEAVLSNKGILSVKRYVSSHNQETIDSVLSQYKMVRLNDVADINRCHMIKPSEDNKLNKVSEIGPININSYFQVNDSKPFKQYSHSDADIEKVKKQTLLINDIVFVMKGSVGKMALIDKEYEGCIASQSFVIIRLKDADTVDESNDAVQIISPTVLFRYLSSDIGRELISQKFSGTTVPMVKMQDLKELVVPIPSLNEQEEIIANQAQLLVLLEQKKSTERKIDEQFNKVWGVTPTS